MRRREFWRFLGRRLRGHTLLARPTLPVVGLLSSRSPGESASLIYAFHQGLNEAGYVEGQSVVIQYRWAEGHYDRLPALAADLVSSRVAVIATVGGTVSALAAKAATATIPIEFISDDDPVKVGRVGSLSRPDGNATGVSQFTSVLTRLCLRPTRHVETLARGGSLIIDYHDIAEGSVRSSTHPYDGHKAAWPAKFVLGSPLGTSPFKALTVSPSVANRAQPCLDAFSAPLPRATGRF
jgi:hypothetical protein